MILTGTVQTAFTTSCKLLNTEIMHAMSTHIAVTPDMFAKMPAPSSRMLVPPSHKLPVHAGALHPGLRVRVPSEETKKWQSDDSHVVTCRRAWTVSLHETDTLQVLAVAITHVCFTNMAWLQVASAGWLTYTCILRLGVLTGLQTWQLWYRSVNLTESASLCQVPCNKK